MILTGAALAACAVGCSSDPEATANTMNLLGTVATAALEASRPPPPPPPPRTIIVQQPVVQQPVYVAQPVVVQQPVAVAQPVAVQQPIVQQPTPVVQTPAPAVAAPAPVATAPVVKPAAAAAPVASAAETAEPEFKYGRLIFKLPATPEQLAAAKAKVNADASRAKRLQLEFGKKVDEATISAAITQFPNAMSVRVDSVKMASLAAFSQLRSVQKVSYSYGTDLDLTPLAGLPELTDVNLYGSSVTSFAPLASCPKLERVHFYAVKSSPEGYASLGLLRQVKKFHGGLTKMTSLEWLRQVPQAEELQIFAEKIADLTPISTLKNLTYLRCWNMSGDTMSTPVGDLALLAGNTKLRTLELPGSRYSNTAALASLVELEALELSNAKEPVDVAFVAKLPKLKRLDLNNTAVVNGAAVSALPKTVTIYSNKKTTGL